MLTVAKPARKTVGVLQDVKPQKQLGNTIVSKCSNGINVIESAITSPTAAGPDIRHQNLRSFI